MDLWTFILLVTMVGCAVPMWDSYLKHQKAKLDAGRGDEDLARELESLKERIAVLEEIVTDGRFQLEREIKALDETGS